MYKFSFASLQFYQISIILISTVMIYFGVERYLKHQASQSLLKLAIRIIVWGGMSAIAVFPGLTDQIAKFVGISDNINAIVMLGFLFVFLLIFKILSVIERIEQNISTLTRNQALKKIKKR